MPTVCLVRPSGYPHAEALAELEETVRYGLEAAGLWGGPPRIVLGAHLPGYAPQPGDIIYNTEHPRSGWWAKEYWDLMRMHETWDYSPTGYGLHVPIGYVPQLTRIPKPARQPIDVLFYGSINERRQRILRDCRKAGLRTEAVFGVYGKERDTLIARAKVVLNMHYYLPGEFESVRVSYLWANRKCVVLESGPNHFGFSYDALVPACVGRATDTTVRAWEEEGGFSFFSATSEADILREALCEHL